MVSTSPLYSIPRVPLGMKTFVKSPLPAPGNVDFFTNKFFSSKAIWKFMKQKKKHPGETGMLRIFVRVLTTLLFQRQHRWEVQASSGHRRSWGCRNKYPPVFCRCKAEIARVTSCSRVVSAAL